MARFVPPLDPATLTNNGERAVATALADQLPNSVTVYHGYLLLERVRPRTGREFFREGEIDFVLFDHRRAILVPEVKDHHPRPGLSNPAEALAGGEEGMADSSEEQG